MKTTLTILYILLGLSPSFSQEINPDSVKRIIAVYKPLLETDTIDYSKRKIFKVNEGLFKIEDRYASGVLASKKYSKDIPLKKDFAEVGNSSDFFENGEIKTSIVRLENGNKIQISKFFLSGTPYMSYEIMYPGGIKTVDNVYDTQGNPLIIDGNGRATEISFLKDNMHVEFGSYENGRKIGKWIGYYDNGEKYYGEEYNQEGLIYGRAFDKTGKEYSYTKEEVSPEFIGGEKMMYQFLGKNTIYPAAAQRKNATGRIVVQFIIEKDGSVSEIKHLNDGFPSLVEEAKRVVKAMSGKWIPGKKRGIPIRVYFNLPIYFSLG